MRPTSQSPPALALNPLRELQQSRSIQDLVFLPFHPAFRPGGRQNVRPIGAAFRVDQVSRSLILGARGPGESVLNRPPDTIKYNPWDSKIFGTRVRL